MTSKLAWKQILDNGWELFWIDQPTKIKVFYSVGAWYISFFGKETRQPEVKDEAEAKKEALAILFEEVLFAYKERL